MRQAKAEIIENLFSKRQVHLLIGALGACNAPLHMTGVFVGAYGMRPCIQAH